MMGPTSGRQSLSEEMNREPCTIIGIDCAVESRKRGVAVGIFDGQKCSIQLPRTPKTDISIASIVAQSMQEAGRVLIAIDAPLGWPSAFGRALASHAAGCPLPKDANSLFRRHSDNFIKSKTGQQPLDVGADRIARTAHAALGILEKISSEIGHGRNIPLAWGSDFTDVAAIEVYPAATLKACGLPHAGYKEKGHRDVREIIAEGLRRYLVIADIEPMLSHADTLDAVVCVLAGLDFLSGKAYLPDRAEMATALKEGWIWVRQKKDES